MSITVRLWSDSDLKKTKTDEWLATLLMNKGTFNGEEINAYNSIPFKKRTFACDWFIDEQEEESVVIYATSIKTLRKFIEKECTGYPTEVTEVITKYKKIDLKWAS